MIDLLVAWVAFPLLLLALCAGCGLACEAVLGRRVPGALIPGLGFAVIVLVGQFLTMADGTAELTVPAIAVLAAGGLLVGARGRGRPVPWALAAAAGAFAVFAAPVVLSGEATIAGFIKLDDTATWLALTDRVMDHGRSLDGLAPSTYEATLAFNLADGYPVGVFLPFGAAAKLTGTDPAWLVQPYMAFLAVPLALAAWELLGSLVKPSPMRAVAAFLAAQPALLYGYYLWGGIKEIAAAALLATAAGLLPAAIGRSAKAAVPLAIVAAALVGVLSPGGLVWLLVPLLIGLAVVVGGAGAKAAAGRAMLVAALIAALSVPILAGGALKPPTSAPLDSPDAIGNLIEPLRPAQLAGIWPAGDFRLDADATLVVYPMIAVLTVAGAFGLFAAWRRRAWGPLAFVAGSLAGCTAIYALGSPWVDGKALATASVALPLAAGLGAGALWSRGLRAQAGAVLALLAAGLVWSNALAYREVNLAPRDQLEELAQIGDRIAGLGPALMTEYSPYGARHFLRGADAEGISELRRNRIPLRGGDTVPKSGYADTDELALNGLLSYRALVLRRSPFQSRPPGPYRLAWSGADYELWTRKPGEGPELSHLPLGDEDRPVGQPDCERVRALARRAAPGDRLLIAGRPAPVVIRGETLRVHRAGDYSFWLRGSLRSRAELDVDGRRVGEAEHVLNNQGQFVGLGSIRLAPGRHRVELDVSGTTLHPGTGGRQTPLGPLVASRGEAADARLRTVEPSRAATELCGHRWDWIEVAR